MEENELSSETSLLESEWTPKPDLRLGGTSQKDTNTLRGQSALVTGVSYSGRSRTFSSYDTPTTGTTGISEPGEVRTELSVQVNHHTSARHTRDHISEGINCLADMNVYCDMSWQTICLVSV